MNRPTKILPAFMAFPLKLTIDNEIENGKLKKLIQKGQVEAGSASVCPFCVGVRGMEFCLGGHGARGRALGFGEGVAVDLMFWQTEAVCADLEVISAANPPPAVDIDGM